MLTPLASMVMTVSFGQRAWGSVRGNVGPVAGLLS
jgi:hypothetical protein